MYTGTGLLTVQEERGKHCEIRIVADHKDILPDGFQFTHQRRRIHFRLQRLHLSASRRLVPPGFQENLRSLLRPHQGTAPQQRRLKVLPAPEKAPQSACVVTSLTRQRTFSIRKSQLGLGMTQKVNFHGLILGAFDGNHSKKTSRRPFLPPLLIHLDKSVGPIEKPHRFFPFSWNFSRNGSYFLLPKDERVPLSNELR